MKQISILSCFGGSGKNSSNNSSLSASKKRRRVDGSHFGHCPLCEQSFSHHVLLHHAANCQGKKNTSKNNDSNVCCTREESTPAIAHSNARERPSSALSTNHAQHLPPGLYVWEDFITEHEEMEILKDIDTTLPDWKESRFNGLHRGKRWGVHCQLQHRQVVEGEHDFPPAIQHLVVDKLQTIDSIMRSVVPNEGNAIEYRRSAGHYLKSHVDDRQLSLEPIANLSLAGDCIMTFTHTKSGREWRVHLPRRCLQILTGAARYDCSHGIDASDVLSDRRVSLTVRHSPLTAQRKPALVKPPRQPIPGLYVFENFITPDEEKEILDYLDFQSPQSWKKETHTGHHREQRFGLHSDLWSREVTAPKYTLPSFVAGFLQPKFDKLACMQGCVMNEMNAIDYRQCASDFLKAHVDDRAKHKEPIANLSLSGSCIMTFTNQNWKGNLSVKEVRVRLPPRCLQVLTGKARYDFSHGIDALDILDDRRVSLTFRETVVRPASGLTVIRK